MEASAKKPANVITVMDVRLSAYGACASASNDSVWREKGERMDI